MRRYSDRSQRAFSLVEVLVAIGVISIVLAMAIFNYGTILPNYKANSAMDQLLSQLRSARERAIAHRREVQVQFVGTNQLTVTEIWLVGAAPPPTTVTFEGGAQYTAFKSVPDIPAPYSFGNSGPINFGATASPPANMRFSTTGAFIDAGNNTLLNGTVFLGIPGKPLTARAISVLGAAAHLSLNDDQPQVIASTYHTSSSREYVAIWYLEHLSPEFARQDSGPKKLPEVFRDSHISDDDIAFLGERGDQVRVVSLSTEDTGTRITLLRSSTKPPTPAPTPQSPTQ